MSEEEIPLGERETLLSDEGITLSGGKIPPGDGGIMATARML